MDAMKLIDLLKEQDVLTHALSEANDNRMAAAADLANAVLSGYVTNQLDLVGRRIEQQLSLDLKDMIADYTAACSRHRMATEDFLSFQAEHSALIAEGVEALNKVAAAR